MGTDEFDSGKKKVIKRNLEEMSIEALGEYIVELEVEIFRVREVITQKEVAQTNAKSFFKK
jgi:hypothetical protein